MDGCDDDCSKVCETTDCYGMGKEGLTYVVRGEISLENLINVVDAAEPFGVQIVDPYFESLELHRI